MVTSALYPRNSQTTTDFRLPHQGPLTATARQGHAGAEDKPAGQRPEPINRATGIKGATHVEIALVGQQVGAQDGNCDSQQPRAHPSPFTHVHHIGDGTHGTEACLVGDIAEDQGQEEAEPCHNKRRVLHVFHSVTPICQQAAKTAGL